MWISDKNVSYQAWICFYLEKLDSWEALNLIVFLIVRIYDPIHFFVLRPQLQGTQLSVIPNFDRQLKDWTIILRQISEVISLLSLQPSAMQFQKFWCVHFK